MRSNAVAQAVLQSYKETRSYCPDHPDKLSGPPATIRGWGKVPKDVMRSDLTPAAKLVFAALAGELYRRETVEMTHAEIGACCGIGEHQVRRSLRVLVAKSLVEQRRRPVGPVAAKVPFGVERHEHFEALFANRIRMQLGQVELWS